MIMVLDYGNDGNNNRVIIVMSPINKSDRNNNHANRAIANGKTGKSNTNHMTIAIKYK